MAFNVYLPNTTIKTLP